MTVEAIKEAIAGLPPEQKASLTAWLLRQDLDEWDKQIEEDFSPGGRGMALLEEAESSVRAGGGQPLDEFLTESKSSRKQHKPRS